MKRASLPLSARAPRFGAEWWRHPPKPPYVNSVSPQTGRKGLRPVCESIGPLPFVNGTVVQRSIVSERTILTKQESNGPEPLRATGVALGILRRLAPCLLVCSLLACEHTAPFSVPNYAPTTVLVPGQPARLTYSVGSDSRPSWLPNGAALLYSEEREDQPDRDRCLALMGARGGAIVRQTCVETDPFHDSLNALGASAVNQQNRIAFFRTAMSLSPENVGYERGAIVVGTSYASPLGTVAQILPYIGPSGHSIDYVSAINWSGPNTLVFVGEEASYSCANPGCTRSDTTLIGVEIDRVDLQSGMPVLTEVPGTDFATAVTAAGPDTIYYTLSSGGQVHRRMLSNGDDSVMYTFAAGAASGLSYAAGRLAATVSGALYVLSLDNGSVQVLPGTNVDRPALSPDGRLLVAEVSDPQNGFIPDLWLWTVP